MIPRIKTRKMQVYRFYKKQDSSQMFIDWATSMLADGHDSPSLRILAGLVVPNTSLFEINVYLYKSLEELGIPILEEEDAIKGYAYEILTDFVENRIEKDSALKILSDIANETDSNSINDFYTLYYTLSELQKYPFERRYLWDGATSENIDQIIMQTARDWLEENKEFRI